MRLFAQSLKGQVRDWYLTLTARSIVDMAAFKTLFLGKWEEKKNSVQIVSQYTQLKRGNDESVKNFSARFNSVYNSLPADCKPPEGMAKMHYAESFDDDFALILRERRSPTLADMMNNAIEVEINLLTSKKGKYKTEVKKVKEEPQPSSLSTDPKFDSLMKVMEKLVDKLSIDDRQVARKNEPQIRNPNYRQPRQPGPPPPQIL